MRGADFSHVTLRPGSAPCAGRTSAGYVPAEVYGQERHAWHAQLQLSQAGDRNVQTGACSTSKQHSSSRAAHTSAGRRHGSAEQGVVQCSKQLDSTAADTQRQMLGIYEDADEAEGSTANTPADACAQAPHGGTSHQSTAHMHSATRHLQGHARPFSASCAEGRMRTSWPQHSALQDGRERVHMRPVSAQAMSKHLQPRSDFATTLRDASPAAATRAQQRRPISAFTNAALAAQELSLRGWQPHSHHFSAQNAAAQSVLVAASAHNTRRTGARTSVLKGTGRHAGISKDLEGTPGPGEYAGCAAGRLTWNKGFSLSRCTREQHMKCESVLDIWLRCAIASAQYMWTRQQS